MLSIEVCESARLSRDVRFDGRFFTAVITTGIFCRPICPARAPKPENVTYYASAELAQQSGFRPCKRCFPQLAPNLPLPRKIKQITQAYYENDYSLQKCTKQLDISDRQIRRLFIQDYGLPPSEFFHQQRLLLAHKLLVSTSLSITNVAFAAGFNSIRRFNQVIMQNYQTTPSDIRGKKTSLSEQPVTILLPYKAPFDWPLMLSFFHSRKMTNIEDISTEHYFRTIELDDCRGWIKVTHHQEKIALNLTVKLSDYSYLHQIITRVRRMFDLDADMQLIHQQLIKQPKLASVIEQFPGLRLPGCWDIFEFSIRAILGQQISVKGATTLAQRIVEKYGDNALDIEQPGNIKVTKYFPNVAALINLNYQDIGLTRARIATLQTWVAYFENHDSIFTKGLTIEELEAELTKLKGIGPWTVNYIGMRGLSDPDAFPSADLGIIKALTAEEIKPKNKDILTLAESRRPWRAYAAIYLWQSLATQS
ncbi:DNA-3-methyladenine glycosylase 2 family protein [Colwellia sp. MB02u-6]|uniref:DNA-3-methyladenine glycosylase 2 family protein n=1 Tax=Colwellia sp. MB02u-6 TaxID=2759824 RepID=UPI0015F75198|nr:DNA-3-methyladenine glycosylase 2 [Colwellia sp. MB02u-6]MBA6327092.1 DNA-3-methyladenine glycosylase 2 family protein [Colwellia sp. MB02u-6]